MSNTEQDYQDIILPNLSSNGEGDDDRSTTSDPIEEVEIRSMNVTRGSERKRENDTKKNISTFLLL